MHLKRHLQIVDIPIYSHATFADHAIPQFNIGSPALYGVSVEPLSKGLFK